MSTEDLFSEYSGRIVPQSYHGGFVALSCVVSFIGAATTLELINRRTGRRGLFNNVLLVSSAVTMGSVGIWSMHFIANRAIELASGEPEMQISYSPGFTVLSFLVPIAVLVAAFIPVGANSIVSWWRVSVGGIFCGSAVCGSVVGAAVIAVAASTVALSMFFIFRSIWTNSLWKRILSASILAGAVSGMHWCAALGTQYRFVSTKLEGSGPSRDATAIAVICLAVGACLIIAASSILTSRNMAWSARKAQHITLAAAVFDMQGRILVDTDGLIPSTVITHSFLEKGSKEDFSIAHPLFHWAFEATRNWDRISSLIGGMKNHLNQLSHSNRDKNGRSGIELINNLGELIDGYDIIFRELFCVAAVALASRLKEHLTSAGILWDQILPTGATGNRFVPLPRKAAQCARGHLMFLVRRVQNERDADQLASAGYRFAEPKQVSIWISSRMQIQSTDLESKLREMAAYTDQPRETPPGISVGFFGIKARVDRSGFDVLVPKGARNLLPAASLPIGKLEDWHTDFWTQYRGMPLSYVLQALEELTAADSTPREKVFASQLSHTIKSIRKVVQDPLVDEARLTPIPVTVPRRDQDNIETITKLLTFQLLIPIHSAISSPNCEFIPLNFFKVLQLSPKQQLDFVQRIYREFGSIDKGQADPAVGREEREQKHWTRLWQGVSSESGRAKASVAKVADKLISKVTVRRLSSSGTLQSGSTVDLCLPGSRSGMGLRPNDNEGDSAVNRTEMVAVAKPYNAILVSEEITVDDDITSKGDEGTCRYPVPLSSQNPLVRSIPGMGRKAYSTLSAEKGSVGHIVTTIRGGLAQQEQGLDMDHSRTETFVDILFEQCVAGRNSHMV